jgi:ribokinase
MNAPAFDVIVCGSLHLDIMLYALALPQRDETVAGRRWAQTCGGKGGNQAVMAARTGARTAFIGRVGDDEVGRRLMQNLKDAGVDASEVAVDPEAGSGMSAAIVQDDGEYGAVIVSGANLAIPPERVFDSWRALGDARVLVLQNEVPEAVNVAAATAARGGEAKVILNAAPARAMSEHFLALVDILVVNRVEAAMMAGGAVASREQALEAAPRLGSAWQAVVITLGGEGLVLRAGESAPEWIAPHPVRVVSTHGAGDCFVGALAARLAAGASLREAASAANLAAAEFVAQRGRDAMSS